MASPQATPKKSNRAKGEGTFFQVKNGWVFQVTLKDTNGTTFRNPDGSAVRKSFKAPTKSAALQRYRQESPDIIAELKQRAEQMMLARGMSNAAISVIQDDRIRARELDSHQISILRQPVPSEYSMYFNNGVGIYRENYISLVDWIYKYIVFYCASRKATTRGTYLSILYRDIQPYFGEFPLILINFDILQSYINYLSSPAARHQDDPDTGYPGLNPKSIRNIICIVRGAIRKAVYPPLNILSRDPTIGLDLPRIITPKIRVMSEEEMLAFIREMRRERLCMAMFISLFTGIRMGELLALDWTDLDEQKQRLKIDKNLERVQVFDDPSKKTELVLQRSAKSAAGNRFVPIPAEFFAILLFHRKTQLIQDLPNPMNLIFPSKKGTYTDPRTYQRRVQQVVKRAGLEDISVHTLRHTFATRLVENDVHMAVLKEIMGHSSIKTTERYVHAAADLQDQAVNTLNKYLPDSENFPPQNTIKADFANKTPCLQVFNAGGKKADGFLGH